jgi:hypothetical protein
MEWLIWLPALALHGLLVVLAVQRFARERARRSRLEWRLQATELRIQALLAQLRCRCPQCGQGPLRIVAGTSVEIGPWQAYLVRCPTGHLIDPSDLSALIA